MSKGRQYASAEAPQYFTLGNKNYKPSKATNKIVIAPASTINVIQTMSLSFRNFSVLMVLGVLVVVGQHVLYN